MFSGIDTAFPGKQPVSPLGRDAIRAVCAAVALPDEGLAGQTARLDESWSPEALEHTTLFGE